MSLSFKDILHNNFTRILFSVLVGFIGLSIIYISSFYFYQTLAAEREQTSKLKTLATTVAQQVDGHEYTKFISAYSKKDQITANYQNAVYNKYHNLFTKVKKSNQLQTEIYTLTYVPEKKHFFFGFSSSETPHFRHIYDTYPQELVDNYTTGGYIEPYHDEHGYWISAFHPIFDRYGDVVGIVQVDERFDSFIAQVRKRVWMQVGITSLFLVIAGFFIIKTISKFLKDEEDIKKEIQKQKHLIEHKNAQITSSISYAKRIQDAIMPQMKCICDEFSDSFVLYLPRDIVSGDFYFFTKRDDGYTFIAAADCTGHGVPGAMMSMISSALLSEMINKKQLIAPGAILDHVENGLLSAFQTDETNQDGLDLALCAINQKTMQLHYAGAYRPLVQIRDGELTEHKPNRFSICGERKNNLCFSTRTVEIQKGDQFYMFSDGYADQFGGKDNKKFMSNQLRELLLDIHEHPCEEQERILKRSFIEWRGDNEQMDDVIVLGFRI